MSPSNRPLSPHIQIYRPQITSVLSITHRISGIALSAGAALFVWQLLAAATGADAFAVFQGILGSWVGVFALVAWTFAFFFHFANGIRHLVWDTGHGFDLPSVYRGGVMVLTATVVLTAVTWVIAFLEWRS